MGLTYFKRFRMEIDLRAPLRFAPKLPSGYRFVPWNPGLLEVHADTKYRSFRMEVDANVFPCLGDADGCLRLMGEIASKDGFLPQATWLVAHDPGNRKPSDYCATIQGISNREGIGAIQNLGVTPEHRGSGLGSAVLIQALAGFRQSGLSRAYLEVTAQNDAAIRLYRRLGFRRARTVYKAVEVAYT
jgi:hypothetical protein